MNLTDEDRVKIKKKIRNCLFYSLIIIILCSLINIGYLMDIQDNQNIKNTLLDSNMLILDLVLVLSSFILFYFLSRKLYLDLKSGNKVFIEKNIQEKVFENKCDSAADYKRDLGTPNAYYPKPYNFSTNYYFVIDKIIYYVSESDFYDYEEKENIKFYYTEYSKTFLGFGK